MAVTTIGGNVSGASVFSVSITPVSVAAATTVDQSFVVPGVRVGDFVIAGSPTITTGIATGRSRVTAANTVAITFVNVTAGALVPPVGAYMFSP